MPKFIIEIASKGDELIKNPNIACYLLDSAIEKTSLQQMASKLRETGCPLLIRGGRATELCCELGLDGVLIEVNNDAPYKKQVAAVREKIGARRILGVVCPLSRHAMMIVSEAEPEFMAFHLTDSPQGRELVSWYNELFLIQSAVFAEEDSALLSALDPDFVILKPHDLKNFGC